MRTRRTLAAAALLLAAPLLLAACGSDPEPGPESDAGAAPTSAGSQDAAFPVTVTHEYGETTVPADPQRVVSVGVTEHDVLLALGVTPVAVTEWYGEQPSATWPWAQELLGDAEPEVLETADGFELEKIAALAPDLIVGTNSGMSRGEYEKLSQIAPTVAGVAGGSRFFSPWRDQTRLIAQAVGRAEEGEAVIERVDTRYAEVAAAHPEWQGLTATFAQGGPYDGQLYVYPPGLSTDFLTDLGFTITTGFEDLVPEEGSQATISAENVGLIDADVIVFATESAEQFDELQEFGTVGDLEAVAGDRAVYTDEVTAGAIYFDTPLAHEHVLDVLVPALEAAVEGRAPRAYPS